MCAMCFLLHKFLVMNHESSQIAIHQLLNLNLFIYYRMFYGFMAVFVLLRCDVSACSICEVMHVVRFCFVFAFSNRHSSMFMCLRPCDAMLPRFMLVKIQHQAPYII